MTRKRPKSQPSWPEHDFMSANFEQAEKLAALRKDLHGYESQLRNINRLGQPEQTVARIKEIAPDLDLREDSPNPIEDARNSLIALRDNFLKEKMISFFTRAISECSPELDSKQVNKLARESFEAEKQAVQGHVYRHLPRINHTSGLSA